MSREATIKMWGRNTHCVEIQPSSSRNSSCSATKTFNDLLFVPEGYYHLTRPEFAALLIWITYVRHVWRSMFKGKNTDLADKWVKRKWNVVTGLFVAVVRKLHHIRGRLRTIQYLKKVVRYIKSKYFWLKSEKPSRETTRLFLGCWKCVMGFLSGGGEARGQNSRDQIHWQAWLSFWNPSELIKCIFWTASGAKICWCNMWIKWCDSDLKVAFAQCTEFWRFSIKSIVLDSLHATYCGQICFHRVNYVCFQNIFARSLL